MAWRRKHGKNSVPPALSHALSTQDEDHRWLAIKCAETGAVLAKFDEYGKVVLV